MWEQIRANRRRSAVFLFAMICVLTLLGYLIGEAIAPGGGVFGLAVALVIWGIQMIVYFAAAERILLGSAHARELQREDSPRLSNIVEEMKLASGLEFTPRIFLIDDPTPNAFAIGRKPETSAIAVTTGLVHRLNRDELQGVIAHEIGHLKNRDVQFMTLAAVLLGSIILLAELFLRGLRGIGRSSSRSRSRGGGQAQLVLFLIAILFAILAPILAQLLYFACSRKREYLADASAAQFTRYPEGLASALQKIAGAQRGLSFASKATAPMFIVNPLQASGGAAFSLFSTHPPTEERIRILRSMGGAGLTDYEAAYHKLKGTGTQLIGADSLQQSTHTEIREASRETEGALNPRDIRSVTHRLDGYLALNCSCGLITRVPERYERNEIHCVRCGSVLAMPTVAELRVAAPSAPAETRVSTEDQTPLVYVRKGKGWQSFRCRCGRTLQLSPSFSAPRLECRKCGREIAVMQDAEGSRETCN